MAHQIVLLTLLICTMLSLCYAGGKGGGNKHVVIHVPLKVKNHHHTHTIVKHIHHGGGDEYKVLGYTHGDHGHEAYNEYEGDHGAGGNYVYGGGYGGHVGWEEDK